MNNSLKPNRSYLRLFLIISAVFLTAIASLIGIIFIAGLIWSQKDWIQGLRESWEVQLASEFEQSQETSKDPLVGLSAQEVNPFFAGLEDHPLIYDWQDGRFESYRFSYQVGEDGEVFQLEGDITFDCTNRTVRKDFQDLPNATCFAVAPGYVVTSGSAVRHATQMEVRFDNHVYAAKLIDVDPIHDLAVLRISGTPPPLQLAPTSETPDSKPVSWLATTKVDGRQTNPLPNSESNAEPKLSDANASSSKSRIVELFPVQSFELSSRDRGQNASAKARGISADALVVIDHVVEGQQWGAPVLDDNLRVQAVCISNTQLIMGQLINGQLELKAPESDGTIGFAVRANVLEQLLRRNSIPLEPTQNTNNQSASSPTDAESVRSSIARSMGSVVVRGVPPYKGRELDFVSRYSGSLKSAVGTFNGERRDGDYETLTVDNLGRIANRDKEDILPYWYSTIPELVFERIDYVSESEWIAGLNAVTKLPEAAEPVRRRRFGGPLLMRASRSPASLGLLPSRLEQHFRVSQEGTDELQVEVALELLSNFQADKPNLRLSGTGVFTFDPAARVLIRKQYEATATILNGSERQEYPIRLELNRVDPEIVADIRRRAAEAKAKIEREKELERTQPNPALVTQLLEQLQKAEGVEARKLLKRLSEIALVDDLRESVMQSVRQQIQSKNRLIPTAAWAAYRHWAVASHAPELRRVIKKSARHRKQALLCLAELGLQEDLPLLLSHVDDRQVRSLVAQMARKTGAKIQPEVLKAIEETDDLFTQIELLSLLSQFGTPESIPQLMQIQEDASLGLRMRIEQTVSLIKEKNKSSSSARRR